MRSRIWADSLWQIFDTLFLIFGLWAAMVYTVSNGIALLDYPNARRGGGSVLVRIFIFFHDCCHGSFFASRRANAILGYITGILTFTPFEHWRYTHNSIMPRRETWIDGELAMSGR